MNKNPMREIKLDKLTLNIGVGEPGPKLDKGKALLEKISQVKVVTTKTHKRTSFGPTKGRPIGAKVTLRGEPALELLGKLLQAVESRLKPGQFDRNGNFSFGIQEYIHIPGIKYITNENVAIENNKRKTPTLSIMLSCGNLIFPQYSVVYLHLAGDNRCKSNQTTVGLTREYRCRFWILR